MLKVLSLILLVVTLILAMVFSSRNSQAVSVDFIVLQFSLPISLWIIASLLLGALLGLFASSSLFFKLLLQKRKTKKVERNIKAVSSL